jgi:uncharacterized membrane protein YagU involved in acid resistance
MSSVATATPTTLRGSRTIALGVAGGIVGGILFGILMAVQGMLPMVAALIGSEDPVVGFGVHLVISAGAGVVFGLAVAVLPALVATPVAAVASGAVYGVIWWIGGALIAMPLMLGMNEMVLAVGGAQLMSLAGHLVFGVATGLVVYVLARRG